MTNVESYVARALQTGRISSSTYRLLTGLAMLLVAALLWSARSDDRAAGPVAVVLLILALVSIGAGVRAAGRRGAS